MDEVILKFVRTSATKMAILKALSGEPMYIRELSRKLGSSPSNILKHLTFLEGEGIVKSRKMGKNKFYLLTEEGSKIIKI